jgi:hypothetical protein
MVQSYAEAPAPTSAADNSTARDFQPPSHKSSMQNAYENRPLGQPNEAMFTASSIPATGVVGGSIVEDIRSLTIALENDRVMIITWTILKVCSLPNPSILND